MSPCETHGGAVWGEQACGLRSRHPCAPHWHCPQNKLTRLPESTCKLVLLTELNVAANNLAYLPPQFGDLVSLKRLNLHDNLLQVRPSSWESERDVKSCFLTTKGLFQLSCVPSVACCFGVYACNAMNVRSGPSAVVCEAHLIDAPGPGPEPAGRPAPLHRTLPFTKNAHCKPQRNHGVSVVAVSASGA